MPATDPFSNHESGLQTSARHFDIVTPDDAADLPRVTKAIALNEVGTVKVTSLNGDTLVIPSGCIAAGIPFPIRVTRIWETSTTPSSILALYE